MMLVKVVQATGGVTEPAHCIWNSKLVGAFHWSRKPPLVAVTLLIGVTSAGALVVNASPSVTRKNA